MSQRAPSWLPPLLALRRKVLLLFLSLIALVTNEVIQAKSHWTELNLGPFYVDTDTDPAAARDALVQLEQLRWVLGSLLESKDLPSLWPFRVILTGPKESERSARLAGEAPPQSFFRLQSGQYLYVAAPGRSLPLSEVAGLLLDANTPRLPASVESGLRQLFSTLEAHGSRVRWGGQPLQPDLDWARMQLFATKFEYGASFHIFLTALKGGSTFAAAERNALGKPSDQLEAEARANLASGHWDAVPVSGRPLDPKRDFGEHSLDEVRANVYLADWNLASDRHAAEACYQAAINSGDSAALGYEGLAQLATLHHEDPKAYLDDAIRAGSHSAPVYVAAAQGLPEAEALPLLKRAARLNERWAEPVYQQVQFGTTPGEKEGLLKTALQLNPRATSYWIELAHLQTTDGQATAAQGSWLKAEDSARSVAERERIHQLRLGSEQERLDAAEAARLRDRNSLHAADEQAQQDESDRIRAAEQKANQSLDSASGEQKSLDVVPWNSLVGEKKLTGTLTRVDCLKDGWRLWVKTRAGSAMQLFLPQETNATLSCGVQPRSLLVDLQYRAVPDEDLHTAGTVTSLKLR